jgi:hypothetical protein
VLLEGGDVALDVAGADLLRVPLVGASMTRPPVLRRT